MAQPAPTWLRWFHRTSCFLVLQHSQNSLLNGESVKFVFCYCSSTQVSLKPFQWKPKGVTGFSTSLSNYLSCLLNNSNTLVSFWQTVASNNLIVVGLQGRDGAMDSAFGVRGGWQTQLRSVIYLTLLLFCNSCRGQRGREQLKEKCEKTD